MSLRNGLFEDAKWPLLQPQKGRFATRWLPNSYKAEFPLHSYPPAIRPQSPSNRKTEQFAASNHRVNMHQYFSEDNEWEKEDNRRKKNRRQQRQLRPLDHGCMTWSLAKARTFTLRKKIVALVVLVVFKTLSCLLSLLSSLSSKKLFADSPICRRNASMNR